MRIPEPALTAPVLEISGLHKKFKEIEVLKGVAAGDRVIVKGQNGLPDGADVTIAS